MWFPCFEAVKVFTVKDMFSVKVEDGRYLRRMAIFILWTRWHNLTMAHDDNFGSFWVLEGKA